MGYVNNGSVPKRAGRSFRNANRVLQLEYEKARGEVLFEDVQKKNQFGGKLMNKKLMFMFILTICLVGVMSTVSFAAPTISASDITYGQNASITLLDTTSGIQYFAVTESTQTTEPTDVGTTEVAIGDTLNYWYKVEKTTVSKTVIFRGLNAGTYKVWAKDFNGAISTATFTVNKIQNPLTVLGLSLKYSGSAQNLITVENNQGIVMYSTTTALTSENYSSGSVSIPSATNAGTYTVYYYCIGNTNYKAKSGSVVTTIAEVIPVLKAEENYLTESSQQIFGKSSLASRTTIKKISIETVIPSPLPTGAVDVSKDSDNSVYAWTTVNASNSSMNDLHIAGNGKIQVTSGKYLFAYYSNCTEIVGLANLDTSNVTSMGDMFKESTSIASVNLSTFDTSNATDMHGMFLGCTKLESVDLSSFDTTKVKDMSEMFNGCTSLEEINFGGNFDTSNVEDMKYMFAECESLEEITLGEKFNTGKVESMARMFEGCSLLKSIPQGLDMSNTAISDASGYISMFEGCSSLTSVTINGKYIASKMFYGCNNLTEIIITSNVQSVGTTAGQTAGAFYYSGDGILLTKLVSTTSSITEDNYSWSNDNRKFIVSLASNKIEATLGKTIYVYDGTAKTPEVTVTCNGTVLTKGEDYEVTYANNTEVGTATATIVGINSYTGKVVKTFFITNTTPTDKDQIIVDLHGPTISNIKGIVNGMQVTVSADISDPDISEIYKGTGVNENKTRYAVTDNATVPSKDSSVWSEENTFIISNVSTVYLWVKAEDNVGNVTITEEVVTVDVTKNVSDLNISLSQYEYTYDKTAKTPTVTVMDSGKTLVKGTDYKVTYKNNINAGTAKVIIEGLGYYKGSTEITFTIKKAIITVPSSPSDKEYNGAVQESKVTIPENTSVVSGNTATNAGTYTLVLKLNDTENYVWDDETTENKSITWKISKYDISKATVSNVENQKYTGLEIKPVPSVVVSIPSGSTTTLTTSDITYTYKNNINVGDAIIIISANEDSTNYTGTIQKTFKIENADLSGSVIATGYTGVYDGLAHGITVTCAGATITYLNNGIYKETPLLYVDAGEYEVFYKVEKENYETVTGSEKVIIQQADGHVTLDKTSESLPYGTASTTFSVTSSHGGSLKVTQTTSTKATVTLSGNTITVSNLSSIAVNTSVTVKVTSGATKNYKEASATYTVTIGSKASISPTVNMKNYTYGGTKKEPSISGNLGNGTVTYYYNTENSNTNGTLWSKVTSSTYLNAGTYYMYAVIDETTNYNGATTAAVKFEVIEASIEGSVTITGTNTYGQNLTVTTSITPSDSTLAYQWWYAESSTAKSGTNIKDATNSTYVVGSGLAGKYIGVTVTAKKENYADNTFTDITDATNNGTATVSKASINPTVSMEDYTYGGTVPVPSVSGNLGNGSVTYYYSSQNSNSGGTIWNNITGTSLNAGTYYMYAVIAETTNYKGATTKTDDFTIAKASGFITLSKTSESIPYGTTSTTFSVTASHGGSLEVAQTTSTKATVTLSGNTITVSNLGSLEVNTSVTVKVTSKATTNYKEASATYTVTIGRKASISPVVNMENYTYGGTKKEPSVSGNLGNGNVTYYYSTANSNANGILWENVTSSTYLNAGTYYMYAVIDETTNYNSAITPTKEFIIAKASLSTSVTATGYTGVYDGLAHGITVTCAGATITYATSENGVYSSTNITYTNAGENTVFYKVEKDNYETLTGSKVVKIDKYNLSNASIASVVDQTYNGEEIKPEPAVTVVLTSGKVTLNANDITYSYEKNTNVGTATITVTAKASSTNYTGSKSINFKIIAKTVAIPTAPSDNKIYNTKVQYSGIETPTNASVVTASSTTSATNAGTYTVVYKLNDADNYTWSDGTKENKSITWKINKYDLSNATIAQVPNQAYTGAEIKPTPTVTVPIPSSDNPTTVTTADIEYGYANNINVGTATITVTAKTTSINYTGSKSIQFAIGSEGVVIPSTPADKVYNGMTQNSGIETPANASIVTESSTTSAINAGTYTVVYKLNDTNNYKWSDGTTTNKTVTWKINKYNLSNATIAQVSNQTYKGEAIKPEPKVTVELASGTKTITTDDIEYGYAKNTNVGTATITVTAKTSSTNYTGSKSINFEIVAKTVTIPNAPIDNKIYNGAAQTSGVTIPANTSVVSGNTGTNAGEYTLILKLNDTENYKWSDGSITNKSITWKINKYDLTKNATIEAVSGKAYTGEEIRPTPTVTVPIPNSANPTKLTTDDITYSYKSNTNVGTATITVTAKTTSTNYTGSKDTTFIIYGAPTMPEITAQNSNGVVASGEWTNKALSITIDGSTLSGDGGIGYKYSFDGSTWYEYDGEVEYTTDTKDAIFYAKAYNRSYTTLESKVATYQIRLDTTAPTDVTLNTVSTTNTITLKVTSVNAEVSGVKQYAFYQDGILKATQTSSEYKFTGLAAEKSYTLGVKITDNAGNETALEKVTASTNKVSGEINLTANKNTWTNEDVIVTIEWPETSLTKQIRINDGEWTNYDEGSYTMTANGTIYARLTDGENNGDAKSLNITCIDKIKPEVTVTSQSLVFGNTNTLNITDNLSGVNAWQVTTTNQVPTGNWTTMTDSTNTTISYKPTKAGTYYAWVKDQAGNISNCAMFEVTKKDISTSSDIVAELNTKTYTYDGNAKMPTATVKDGSTPLTLGTDYNISYSNNTNAGDATATITGIGNYTGTITLSFKINQATATLEIANVSLKVGATTTVTYTYVGDGTTVNVTSQNTGVATVENVDKVNKQITIKGISAGSSKIEVKVSGGTNYADITKTFMVTVNDSTIEITTTKPSDVAVKEGERATFEVEASGTSLQYQWYKASSATATGTAIPGATNSTYTIEASNVTKDLNNTYYYCEIKNNADTKKTRSAKLTVYYKPEITTQPTDASVLAGAKATFSVVVTNGNPAETTYKWQYKENSTSGWVTIENATAATYTTDNVTVDMNGYQYRVLVGNSQYKDEVVSNAVTLTVGAKDLNSTDIVKSISSADYTYDGTAKTQTITIEEGSYKLVENKDYKVTYSDNIDAGDATVTVTGIGDYAGTLKNTFTINKKEITVTWQEDRIFTYTGNLQVLVAGSNNKISGVNSELLTLTIGGAGTEPGEYTALVTSFTVTNGRANQNNYTLKNTQATFKIVGTSNAFVTVWNVPNTTIKLPVKTDSIEDLDIIVDWGDGSALETINATTYPNGFPTHTYASAGEYEIKIIGTMRYFGYVGTIEPISTSDFYTFTKYLTQIKSWGEVSAYQYGFAYCKNLSGTIPTPQTNSFANVTSFENLFYEDSNLTGTIPENLFAKATKATTFTNTFKGCTKLTGEIPASLFANNINVTSFNGTFANCTSLTGSIPSTLFANNVNVTTFNSVFNGCKNITGNIPESLFANNTKVTIMSYIFANCTGITGSIPEKLFASNTKLGNLSGAFSGATGLTGEIPANLFANNAGVTTFSETFKDCTGLTSVPNGLFANNTGITSNNITNYGFAKTFMGCTGLISAVVDSKFVGEQMYYGCNNLKKITITSNVTEIYLPAGEDGAFRYTGTNPEYLPTILLTSNSVATNYDWLQDKRNIDTTGPTIAVENITYGKDASITLKDDISGVAYWAVTNAKVAPTNVGTTYETTGDTINYWYLVENTPLEVTTTFKNLPVGTYYAYGKDLVGNTSYKEFKVTAKKLTDSDIKVTLNEDTFTYDGNEKKPIPTVSYEDKNLVSGTDYEISYKDNVNAGTTATVIITGKGNYEGTKEVTFTIEKAVSSLEVTPTTVNIGVGETKEATISYTGDGTTISAVASDESVAEVLRSGNKLSIEGKKAGSTTITVSVTGATNYENVASKTITVNVYAAPNTPTITAKNTDGKVIESKIWANTNLSIELSGSTLTNPDDVGYKYSYNQTDWIVYDKAISYTEETDTAVLYAKAYNKSYKEMESAVVTYEIKLDKTAPTNINFTHSVTTNTITIEVTSVDAQISGVGGYEFYLNGEKVSEAQTSVYTYTNLKAGETYKVGVKVKDNAGNISNLEAKDIATEKIAGEIKLVASTNDLTKDNVTVTIVWPETELTKQVKLGDGEWQTYNETTYVISENTTIYAKITDGESNGAIASLEISNIDRVAPTGGICIVPVYTQDETKMTNSNAVTIQVTAEDDRTTADNLEMVFINEDEFTKLKSNSGLAWEKYNPTATWTVSIGDGLKTVYVVFKDQAGNQSYYVIEE